MALAFDRVVVTSNGVASRYSANSFLALPLNTRVRIILERSVVFFFGESVVERKAALKSLRELREDEPR